MGPKEPPTAAAASTASWARSLVTWSPTSCSRSRRRLAGLLARWLQLLFAASSIESDASQPAGRAIKTAGSPVRRRRNQRNKSATVVGAARTLSCLSIFCSLSLSLLPPLSLALVGGFARSAAAVAPSCVPKRRRFALCSVCCAVCATKLERTTIKRPPVCANHADDDDADEQSLARLTCNRRLRIARHNGRTTANNRWWPASSSSSSSCVVLCCV